MGKRDISSSSREKSGEGALLAKVGHIRLEKRGIGSFPFRFSKGGGNKRGRSCQTRGSEQISSKTRRAVLPLKGKGISQRLKARCRM